MYHLYLRLIVSDHGTAYNQTTNHPLGEALFFSVEDRNNDMLTELHRHDRDGATQSWRQETSAHSFYINSDLHSGVVDPKMKIYGLTNVRVVDASVIPLTTGVAIQSTVYAIAEKVSLKLEWMGQTLRELSRLQIFLERSGALNRREWTNQHP